MNGLAISWLIERNQEIGERYDVAESFGQLEWLAAILDEKQFLVELLRTIVAQPMLRRDLMLQALGAIRINDIDAAEAAILEALEVAP